MNPTQLGWKICHGCNATACNESSKIVLFPNGSDYCRQCQDEIRVGIPRISQDNSSLARRDYVIPTEKVYLVREEKLARVDRPSEIMLNSKIREKIQDKVWRENHTHLGKVYVTDGERVWKWFDLCYSHNRFTTWKDFLNDCKHWELLEA